jgi:hypothetical protein
MVVYRNKEPNEVNIPSDESFNSSDSNDCFGVEEGDFAVSPTAW